MHIIQMFVTDWLNYLMRGAFLSDRISRRFLLYIRWATTCLFAVTDKSCAALWKARFSMATLMWCVFPCAPCCTFFQSKLDVRFFMPTHMCVFPCPPSCALFHANVDVRSLIVRRCSLAIFFSGIFIGIKL